MILEANSKIGIEKCPSKLVLRVLDEARRHYLRLTLSNANLTFCDANFQNKKIIALRKKKKKEKEFYLNKMLRVIEFFEFFNHL